MCRCSGVAMGRLRTLKEQQDAADAVVTEALLDRLAHARLERLARRRQCLPAQRGAAQQEKPLLGDGHAGSGKTLPPTTVKK